MSPKRKTIIFIVFVALLGLGLATNPLHILVEFAQAGAAGPRCPPGC
jgi:hypothetical protein